MADLAARFAAEFHAAEAARFLGLWHDLGKFHPAFQDYLLSCEASRSGPAHGPDHKGAGATLASKHLPPLALLVQAHHGGVRTLTRLHTWLAERASDAAVEHALELARQALPQLEPKAPIPVPAHAEHEALGAEFFLRMLFSTLVDADFLDTERHFRPQTAGRRRAETSMAALWGRFERDQQRVSGQRSDRVGQARHAIYRHCLAAAEHPPGVFRLTVPTGGGKTRSAMGFALRHAVRHGLRRVIVAVPFTTITEQRADAYRQVFGAGEHGHPIVLEHSAAERAVLDGEEFHPAQVWQRLAAENWDAPIIVTTTVQLFESLFGSGTSPCRKLHRLARSVIVLDEAQALPSHRLTPILDALRRLCTDYGSTVVLSTATQPAFEAIPVFAELSATEIVPDSARFFDSLRRVEYAWRTDRRLGWPDVADLLHGERQALAVVNTKKDALALLDALDDPDALHLSTLLCGAHRCQVIETVKRRLEAGEPCRLVSTQVVEAGVDLDFPLVLRALGPLDGIIQAAGRCNREGRLERGRVIVFRPQDGGMPPGTYLTAAGITGSLLGRAGLDLHDPSVPRSYFRQLFELVPTDRDRIQALRERLEYPEVARRFRMIDDDTESVAITTYGSHEERRHVRNLLDRLARGGPDTRLLLRQLQPYLVSVRARHAERYRQQGLIASVFPGVGEWLGAYDDMRGLMLEERDPEQLVV